MCALLIIDTDQGQDPGLAILSFPHFRDAAPLFSLFPYFPISGPLSLSHLFPTGLIPESQIRSW